MDQSSERDHHAGERLLHVPLVGRRSIERGRGDYHFGCHGMFLGGEGHILSGRLLCRYEAHVPWKNVPTCLLRKNSSADGMVWMSHVATRASLPLPLWKLRRVAGVRGLHSMVSDEILQRSDRLVRALGFHRGDNSDSGADVKQEESAFLSLDAHVRFAMHNKVVGADGVAELGDGLPMSSAFSTGLGLEHLCPEANLAHRVLGPGGHHVPDGGGFRDELVLCSGVQVG